VAHVGATNKTGTWSSLGVESNTPITVELFDLYISHQVRYMYMIFPVDATARTLFAALADNGEYTLAGGSGSGFQATADPSEDVLLGAVWEGGATVNAGCWSVQASLALSGDAIFTPTLCIFYR
jgi:hypothetical protein